MHSGTKNSKIHIVPNYRVSNLRHDLLWRPIMTRLFSFILKIHTKPESWDLAVLFSRITFENRSIFRHVSPIPNSNCCFYPMRFYSKIPNINNHFNFHLSLKWPNIEWFSKVIRENKTAQCQDSGFVSTFRLKPKIHTIIGDQSR